MKISVISALADVAQWIERQPENQKIAGSIPNRGTCLGCRPGSPLGGVQERQPVDLSHIDVSLPLFLPPFPSL